MSISIRYPTVELIIAKHDKVIDESGGSHGLRDLETLKGIIEFIQHDFYYPTFDVKLCHLIYSINKNHVFFDGNKRASLSAGAVFMLDNGWSADLVDWYLMKFEDIVVWLADSKISKDILHFALRCLFVRSMFIESSLPEEKLKGNMNILLTVMNFRRKEIKKRIPHVLTVPSKDVLSYFRKEFYVDLVFRRMLEDVIT